MSSVICAIEFEMFICFYLHGVLNPALTIDFMTVFQCFFLYSSFFPRSFVCSFDFLFNISHKCIQIEFCLIPKVISMIFNVTAMKMVFDSMQENRTSELA